MLASRLAPALLVLLARSAAADDKSITIHVGPDKAGAKWTQDKLEVTHLTVDRKGSKLPVVSSHHVKEAFDIVKVTGATVAEARVAYLEFADTQQLGTGTQQTRPGLVAGKSYTLTAGTPIGVVAATGGKPSDEELALIRKTEKHFGQVDRMAKILDGKTFARDKVVNLPAAELEGVMGDDDSFKVISMALTYRGTDGANAGFDLALKLEGERKGNHTKVDVTGKLAMEVKTGKVMSMIAKGSITATGAQSYDGTIEITESTTR